MRAMSILKGYIVQDKRGRIPRVSGQVKFWFMSASRRFDAAPGNYRAQGHETASAANTNRRSA